MRKIVASLVISLDGVVGEPWKWSGDYNSDEVDDEIWEQTSGGGTLLMGRVTYEEFAAFWPSQATERAKEIVRLRKYVASRTLSAADWADTTLMTGDIEAQIRALKDQDGGPIGVPASGVLVRWLLGKGLLDELNLYLFPVVLGEGKRLFEAGDAIPLRLASSRQHEHGVVHLNYQPA